MPKGKFQDKFDNAHACRAKATSFRTIAERAVNPVARARILTMAEKWEAKAVVFDDLAHAARPDDLAPGTSNESDD